jgi:hypothetical protein
VFFTSDFEASLNYSDSIFGNSLKYQELLLQLFNTTSGITGICFRNISSSLHQCSNLILDAYFAQAGTVLIQSIKAAGTIDPTEVMKHIVKIRKGSNITLLT